MSSTGYTNENRRANKKAYAAAADPRLVPGWRSGGGPGVQAHPPILSWKPLPDVPEAATEEAPDIVLMTLVLPVAAIS